MFHLARALGRRAEVRVLSFGSEPPGPIEGVLERSVPHNLLPSIAANLATPDPLLPMQVRLYLSGRCARPCAMRSRRIGRTWSM